jgi:hypothetical protein
MLLKDKNVVVYGAGGAVGGAVARGFAREGARVFLTARRPDVIDTIAKEITAHGGTAGTAVVDAGEEHAVAQHLDTVVAGAGSVDVSFNAIGIPQEGIQPVRRERAARLRRVRRNGASARPPRAGPDERGRPPGRRVPGAGAVPAVRPPTVLRQVTCRDVRPCLSARPRDAMGGKEGLTWKPSSGPYRSI